MKAADAERPPAREAGRPGEAVHPAAPRRREPRSDRPGPRPHRVVLVRGDEMRPERIREALESSPIAFRVEAAPGLQEALSHLADDAAELVLLGPNPAGAGFERALSALVHHPGAPAVLVVGGPASEEVAAWALEAGATGYLTEEEVGAGRLVRAAVEALANRRRLLRLRAEAEHRAQRMEAVERVFEVVSRTGLTTDQRLEELLALGCELFDQEIGIVSEVQGQRYRVLHAHAPGFDLDRGTDFELGLTFCSITLARQEPVMIDSVAHSDWKSHPCYREQGLDSYIGTKVALGDGREGTLNFSSSEGRAASFTRADRDLIRMMGAWITSVLERQSLHRALEESEEMYRDLVENSSDLICTHDLEGTILSVNQTLVQAYGAPDAEALVGLDVADLLSPEVRHELPEYLDTLRREGRARGYMRAETLDGEELLFEYHNSLRREGVEEPVVRVTARDVTELKRAEAELRHSEEMLRVFVKHTPAAVAMFDRDMRYMAVSDRWRVDYRLGGMELLGKSHYEVFPETADHWREIHRRCLEGGVEQADEDPFPRADGSLDWVRWEVRPWYTTAGEIGGLLLFTEVITDRKRVEDALRYLATHDHLTGLPNRAAFLERLDRALERAERSPDYRFSVFFLDLDGFKKINDSFGHGVGDELLEQVADRLRQELRPKDALARFAGDEFVGLIEDVGNPGEASAAVERLLGRLQAPIRLQARTLTIRASVGIALSGGGEDSRELLARADAAMYRAKQAGEGSWHLAGAEAGSGARGSRGGG